METEYVNVKINKSLLQKVKELFKVEADTDAVTQALEEVSGAKELQEILQKDKGIVIEKRIEDEIKRLRELKGCLGQERAEEYDFELKMRRFHEAR